MWGIICFLLFPVWSHFLSLNLLMFEVLSLGTLWTGMGLVYPLAEHCNNVKEVRVSIWWVNFYFCVFIEHNLSVMVSLGETVAEKYLFHFPLCMESNALEKSTNKSVTSRFFAQTPSKIPWIFRICDVDWFLWKPFWFFLRTFSISCSMWLSSRPLQILPAM